MDYLDIFFTIIIVSFVFYLTYSYVNYKAQITSNLIEDYSRFLAGRTLIMYLTENSSFTNGMCDLNLTKIRSVNDTNFVNILDDLGIHYPVYVEFSYLNGTIINKVGGHGEEYYEFKRVCKANESLVLVKVRT